MALNLWPSSFQHEGETSTSSNNSGSRISGGVGHQQQPTESTDVVICKNAESNNNAILQQSSPPPRKKSTQQTADGSRSTIHRFQRAGNNNWQQGNKLVAAANNNINNENIQNNNNDWHSTPSSNESNNNEQSSPHNRSSLASANSSHSSINQRSNNNSLQGNNNSQLRQSLLGYASSLRRSIESTFNRLSRRRRSSASASALSSTASNARQLTVFCAGSNNNATYRSPSPSIRRQNPPPIRRRNRSNRTRRVEQCRSPLKKEQISCQSNPPPPLLDRSLVRKRQQANQIINNAKRAKREEEREALDAAIHRAKQQRLELVRRVRENKKEYDKQVYEQNQDAIESSRREWMRLKRDWMGPRNECRMSRKRKLDSMDLEHPFLNKELIRTAVVQSKGCFNRREIHDIVEKTDGTFDGVRNYIEPRTSEFNVVQPSRRVRPNPFSTLTLSTSATNSSGSSSTNPYEILSDTAIDEEDDTHEDTVDDTAVDDTAVDDTAVDDAVVDEDDTALDDTAVGPRRSKRLERKGDDSGSSSTIRGPIVETVVEDEDDVESPGAVNKAAVENETIAAEESCHTANEGAHSAAADVQFLIFNCDHASKMLQLQPELLAILKVASDEYKDTRKGLRINFCRALSRKLFERDDMILVRDGIRLDYTDPNSSYVADVLHKLLLRSISSNDIEEYKELLLPPDGQQVKSTPRRVKFATENDIIHDTHLTRCWSESWSVHFPDETIKPHPERVLRTKLNYTDVITITSQADQLDPLLSSNIYSKIFTSDDAATSYLNDTYVITPSEAAEAAAVAERAREESEEDDDDDVAEDVPPVKDRGYFHACLHSSGRGRPYKGRCLFYTAKKNAGCVDSSMFDLASEAALYADCMLYIMWYGEGDNMTFNFDTIRKFERHHSAELSERNITKSLSDSIAFVRSEINSRVKKRGNKKKSKAEVVASRTKVLNSLGMNELCWEHDDDESSGDDEPSDDESSGSGDSSVPNNICEENPIFRAICNGARLKKAFSSDGVKNAIVIRNRTKDKNGYITRAYNTQFGIDPNDASDFMTESGYVSAVHEHHVQHDGYSAYEGKEEDIKRTKKEIAWRRRVAHQIRGLHLALVHKKIRAYEREKVKFIERIDRMGEFWEWMETKRTDSKYVTRYHDEHQGKYCTFTDFKNRVENDTGLKWEELADWGESEWKTDGNRKNRVGIVAYRILKRLDPGCSFCYRLISSYTQASQLYGWHGDHKCDKIDDPVKIAGRKSIPELIKEMKKCRLRCHFCHDFGGTERSWEIDSYTCQLEYPVGVESKPARDVFNMRSFQALLWDIHVRGGYSGRRGFMPFSYDTLEMMVWQHVGIALEDLVTWSPEVWETSCKKKSFFSRYSKMNSVLYNVIKSLSGRCPNPHCLPNDLDFANVSAYHKTGVHMDHVYEGGERQGESVKMISECLVTFLNEICGYTWATCCFCHGIKTDLSTGIEQIYCNNHPGEVGCKVYLRLVS